MLELKKGRKIKPERWGKKKKVMNKKYDSKS